MVLILLFSILPAIFLAPFSGYLCDKYNRKAIIICADSIAALISVFIYICVSYYEFNYFCSLCFLPFLILVQISLIIMHIKHQLQLWFLLMK